MKVTVAGLRSAGLNDEADCLAAAVRTSSVWRMGAPHSEHVLALSTFGSRRYDEMVVLLDVEDAA